jgi:uncharacterized Zn-binding protein involved in type VI secretion
MGRAFHARTDTMSRVHFICRSQVMAARANLYRHSQIIVGDTTTHGGVVLSGSATSSWYGIAIARMGDKVYCPKCKPHFFEIAEGLNNCTDHGKPMAGEGHLTTCGAALIAVGAAPTAPDVPQLPPADPKSR